jgi:hypothetical protein
MAWAHPVAPVVKELTREEAFDIAMGTRRGLRLLRKPTLDAIPRLKVDDRAVQAVVEPLLAGCDNAVQLGSRPGHNHFNQKRHLVTRQIYKQRRMEQRRHWRSGASFAA